MSEPRKAKGRSLVPRPRALGHVSDAPPVATQALGATLIGVLALVLGLAGLFGLGLGVWSIFGGAGAASATSALQPWADAANLPFLTHLPWSPALRWGLTLGSLLVGVGLSFGKFTLPRRVTVGTAYWIALAYLLCWAQDPTGSSYGSWLQGRGWLFAFVVLVPVVLPAAAQRTYLTAAAVALAPALSLLAKAQLEGRPVSLLDAAYAIDGLALIVLAVLHAARSSDWRALHAAALRATWRLREVQRQTERAVTWLPSKPLFKRDAVVDVGTVFPLSSEDQARFEHDAQIACALHSPNLASVFDFGLSTRGEPYMVRENVEGHSFDRLVGKYGAQIPERTLYLLGQACHALVEASEHGLVHGTLTPSSVWIVQRGAEADVVKVSSFAQHHWPADPSFAPKAEPGQKAPSTPAHTPDAYRAPERVAGKFVPSSEADVYALGCIGYWLFAGRPPFIGDAEALERHHAGTVAPTLSQVAGLAPPKDLESILHSCLAKNPSERPSIAVLRRRLLACAAATHWNQGRARDWWQKHPPEQRPVHAKLLSQSRFTIRSLFGDE